MPSRRKGESIAEWRERHRLYEKARLEKIRAKREANLGDKKVKCRSCGNELPILMRDITPAARKLHKCIDCRSSYYAPANKEYYEKHKERINAQNRKSYRKLKKKYPEKFLEKSRRYRKKNKDKINARNRQRRKENPEVRLRAIEATARWRKRHPDYMREYLSNNPEKKKEWYEKGLERRRTPKGRKENRRRMRAYRATPNGAASTKRAHKKYQATKMPTAARFFTKDSGLRRKDIPEELIALKDLQLKTRRTLINKTQK